MAQVMRILTARSQPRRSVFSRVRLHLLQPRRMSRSSQLTIGESRYAIAKPYSTGASVEVSLLKKPSSVPPL